jgi:hypothetical protein
VSFVVKDRVKDLTTTTGTNTLTLAGTPPTGFRGFGDIGNGNTTWYAILEASESAPTQWEVGIGTYTSAGTTLSRDTVLRTSAGNTTKITLASGTHTVICGLPADVALSDEFAQHGITPGGRLTLTSGTPVTTSDVTAATSIYYTPYVSNVIALWNGARWQPVEFSEYTLALGTISNATPYDVFAYLNAGAFACELLAWTNDTTRATAITIQDGRYCKSGAKDRLYLGTFYTTATTTTEDSLANRYLWNMYNRVSRGMSSPQGTSHSGNTFGPRNWNNGSGTLPTCQFVNGIAGGDIVATVLGRGQSSGSTIINASVHPRLNGSTMAGIQQDAQWYAATLTASLSSFAAGSAGYARVGRNYLEVWEIDNSGGSVTYDEGRSMAAWSA